MPGIANHADHGRSASIETVRVEVPNPGHLYGIRGVAEFPVHPPPAAIAIALQRALGIRISELPMTPERIFMKYRECGKGTFMTAAPGPSSEGT